MGSHRHPIKTPSAEAQKYFDQGVTLLFGFNHEEAYRSFAQAAELDPKSPMPHWGMALALGANYNDTEPEADRLKKARAEVEAALALSAGAPENERAYVEALSVRYVADPAERRQGEARARLRGGDEGALGAVSRRPRRGHDVRREPHEPPPVEALEARRHARRGHGRDRRRARVRPEARPDAPGRQPLLHPRRRGIEGPAEGAAVGRAARDPRALGGTPRPHAGAHLHAHGQLRRGREGERRGGRRGSRVHPADGRRRGCTR